MNIHFRTGEYFSYPIDNQPIFVLSYTPPPISEFYCKYRYIFFQNCRTDASKSVKLKWQDIWANVPLGSLLGVFLFLIMINDLEGDIPTIKFVDDTAAFDIDGGSNARIQKAANDITKWSSNNHTKIKAS